jgi:hypothetical protein
VSIAKTVNRGGLVLLVLFACCCLVELSTRAIYHDDQFFQQHRWPASLALLLASGIVRTCLQQNKKALVAEGGGWLISCSSDSDPNQAKSVSVFAFLRVLRSNDCLFHIPMRFWPWILAVLAVVYFVIPNSIFG